MALLNDVCRGGGAAGGAPPEVMLYVKAGADGVTYGACPFCQRVFMLLMLKSNGGERELGGGGGANSPPSPTPRFRFQVATVNLAKPPEEFRKNGLKRLPAILVPGGGVAIDQLEDVVQFLEEAWPSPPADEAEFNHGDDQAGGVASTTGKWLASAESCSKNVFSRFCYLLKGVAKDGGRGLLHELSRLDNHLRRSAHRFLCGARLSPLDCELLPKLHHVRIASAHQLLPLDTGQQQQQSPEVPPTSMDALWRYLHEAYSHPAFVTTCPSDQEIVLHWLSKQSPAHNRHLVAKEKEMRAQLLKQKATYSLHVHARATPAVVLLDSASSSTTPSPDSTTPTPTPTPPIEDDDDDNDGRI